MKVVLSGVNLTEGGPLTIYKQAIRAFLDNQDCNELVCLVHRTDLFSEFDGAQKISFKSYPWSKKNWLLRLYFEYILSFFLSLKLKPDFWFSLHDVTPFVSRKIKQIVYCHNPSPFYSPSYNDFKYDRKFFIFTLIYKFIYRVNIGSNKLVVVQQEFMAKYFRERFGLSNVVVAKPVSSPVNISSGNNCCDVAMSDKINFFYPAFPRTFKNYELIADALKELAENERSESIFSKFSLYLTLSEEQSPYAKHLSDKFRFFDNVVLLGTIDKSFVDEIYLSSHVLLFPSKLETWGLPISEAKANNMLILLSDLPYARETLGNYHQSHFFPPDSPKYLAELIRNIVDGAFVPSVAKFNVDESAIESWGGLVKTILDLRK